MIDMANSAADLARALAGQLPANHRESARARLLAEQIALDAVHARNAVQYGGPKAVALHTTLALKHLASVLDIISLGA